MTPVIDGIGSELIPYMEIAPGESLVDLVGRLGGTIRFENRPDPTPSSRRLSPGAAEFIAGFEREDPQSVLAVYWRYHSLDAEEFDSVEEAECFLTNGEEFGELAGEAIVAGSEIKVCG